MIDTDVFLGLGVGKDEHHATAVTPAEADNNALDSRLPNTEPKLASCSRNFRPRTERCWSWSTSRPRSAPCRWRSPGTWTARSPIGLTMRRIADLYPGEAKTDARDAFIIADAARAMPHTLRVIDGEERRSPSWR
ncbi:transposase [Streptomyces sp. NPDC016675]|uniref:IS110 family transposase n=1 Tax=Streptomyces sp. NPDC016675 TaxID=3364970 RepID=UPI0036FB4873